MRRTSPGLALAALALATAWALALAAAADEPPGPAPLDPGARRAAGDAASEYWDLVALLGELRVMARFTITNEGPGEQSAAAFGHVLRPGAAPVAFQNGRRQGRWRLSPDARRIEIGSSLLDLSDGARRLEVDNDKRGVKLFLDWRADASARSVPGEALPDGYGIDLLQLASPVRASIQVAGMDAPRNLEGTLTLTHTWMPVAESELVLRRIDLMSANAAGGIYLLDIRGPAGARFGWLSVARPGLALERTDIEVRTESEIPPSIYPIPSGLGLDAAGVRGEVRLGPPLLEVDPLAALPSFLRMVYSLRGRPHRSWTEADFQLSWVPGPEHPAVRVAGDAIASLTFLDALPQNQTLP